MHFNGILFSHLFFLRGFSRLLASLLIIIACPVYSDEGDKILLGVKPSKCIALRKGQKCYQTVNFRWHTPANSDYCLFAQGQMTPLFCWHGAGAPPFKYEFVGQQNQQFYLKTQSGEVVGVTEIAVAWVYASNNRDIGGWRLF